MAIRKSVRDLSVSEKVEFTNAILDLKAEASTIMPSVSSYDWFAIIHQQSMENSTPWVNDAPTSANSTRRNSAHRGPAFLPWHRQFLGQFEKELQRISGNPDLGLPYWDWENDDTFPDILGGNGSLYVRQNEEPVTYWLPVSEGPFRFDTNSFTGWVVVDKVGTGIAPLQRSFGTAKVPKRDPITRQVIFDSSGNPTMESVTLPSKQDVNQVLSLTEYDAAPWDEISELETFRNVLEGWFRGPALHNQVHVWVGGSMGPGTSPNDPTFFLHHCNIDKIWGDWQNKVSSGQYEPQTGGPAGHNLKDLMFPWDGVATADTVTPEDVLSLGNVVYALPPAT
jgi:tyrosinase